MRYYFIFCLLFCAFRAQAQIGSSQSLHISDSIRAWSCLDLDAYTYDLLQMTNNTGANLDVTYRLAPLVPSRLPSAWHLQVEYPHSGGYTDSLQGSFRLDGANQQARLFFAAVLPNGQTGLDTLRLVLHPTNNPSDSVEALFILTVLGTTSSIEYIAAPLQIWPNPAANLLNINSPIYQSQLQSIEIRNALGQIMATPNLGQTQVDISTWAAGAYFVALRNNKGQIIDNQMFVKL